MTIQGFASHPYRPARCLDDADTLHEECGVFGIFKHNEAASLTAVGLHALQHRGEEACGIAITDGRNCSLERHVGLVGENFNKPKVLKRLKGHTAIGHNRYSTTGGTILRNVQPLFAELSIGNFAIAHNGNLTNTRLLKNRLVEHGAIFQSTSDTEVILHLVSQSRESGVINRFIDALHQIEGAYALVALTNDMLIGARDPVGIRPLVLGQLEGSYVLASETCALHMIGADFVREVENGEIVVISKDGLQSIKPFETQPARPCVFEYIYFARPDSIVGGRSVYEVREEMGRQLADESPADVDVVVPIPDSGVPAALGFAERAGLPFGFGIIRNHYIGRTFIQPEQRVRELGVRRKHAANAGVLRGKRIVLIDDSVVRGTTSQKIVQLVREAGAIEVHMRIACPPIMHSDYYGIDTPEKAALLAATKSLDQMCAGMGADSLAFLSVDAIYRSIGIEGGRNPAAPQLADHCFTGEYPTALPDLEEFGTIGTGC
ncbi:MAG: amidophosphoribosyltransferase [Alphaproteobacteria bacterium]|nr:amidophosphoribosyltransferase [Alphaproteobacteria bacterium]